MRTVQMLASRYTLIEVSEEEQFTLGTNVLSIGDKKVFSLPQNMEVNKQMRAFRISTSSKSTSPKLSNRAAHLDVARCRLKEIRLGGCLRGSAHHSNTSFDVAN